ncbi:Proline-rich family protein [Hirschfeldia incana]|nr:Proline-rich family protein [Hirschfeldia incana]
MVNLKDHDMGEGMQCITHPYTKNRGGICALCLQDKLGKLVTSSFPLEKPNHIPSSSSSSSNLIYKRSKSMAASYGESLAQRKRSGFWSFLHLSSSKQHQVASTTKKVNNVSHSSKPSNKIDTGKHQIAKTSNQVVGGGIDVIAEEEDESPRNKVIVETPTFNSVGSGGGSSFGRKILRSRSVGCGNRSFSSERISNEFGDCALRRIESHREPTKVISNGGDEAADAVSEMVKCGGMFGGFMIMTPSSSTVDRHHKMGYRSAWGWVSPMRAKTAQRGRAITKSSTDKKTSPKVDSVPSLVTMKS